MSQEGPYHVLGIGDGKAVAPTARHNATCCAWYMVAGFAFGSQGMAQMMALDETQCHWCECCRPLELLPGYQLSGLHCMDYNCMDWTPVHGLVDMLIFILPAI